MRSLGPCSLNLGDAHRSGSLVLYSGDFVSPRFMRILGPDNRIINRARRGDDGHFMLFNEGMVDHGNVTFGCAPGLESDPEACFVLLGDVGIDPVFGPRFDGEGPPSPRPSFPAAMRSV